MKLILTFAFAVCVQFVSAQESKERVSTSASNVAIIQKEFVIQGLNDISHKVWVYLPPNYHSSSKKFPVIYMHDAQNLFDAKTSYLGEWEVDESLNSLFDKTGKGFIVIGIENGQKERINEYTPWPNEKYGGGKGSIYIDFIVSTLKPYVDKNYKTKKGQKHTGIIGSSLGGLISYYAGLKYPKVFGKIGALSTSFWFSDEVHTFTEKHGNIRNQKLFLLVGDLEGEDMVEGQKNAVNLLLKSGYHKQNINTKIKPNGKHNEALWKGEFLNVIRWLYSIN